MCILFRFVYIENTYNLLCSAHAPHAHLYASIQLSMQARIWKININDECFSRFYFMYDFFFLFFLIKNSIRRGLQDFCFNSEKSKKFKRKMKNHS